jgi:RNA polymerase sigma-70 factor (ECF subfamily)
MASVEPGVVERVEACGGCVDSEVEFRAFVDAHQDRALRLALRLVSGDRASAQDIVQDAFIRAHRGLSGFRGEARLSTWFDRILVREAYRHFRRPWRRWLAEEDPAVHMDHAPAPGDPFVRHRIETSLRGLSAHQRTVFVLVHLEGRTVNEVAEILERAPGTVKSHLHRALTRLRLELADLAPAGLADVPAPQSREGAIK